MKRPLHQSSKKFEHSQKHLWLPALLVTLLCFLIYLPSLRSGFVYDAEAQILTDSYIHNPSHFAEVITFRVLGRDVLDFNRPLHLLSLMTDSLLWGKRPLGYHLTNNLLHALNAGMLCLLILHLLLCEKPSTNAAAASVLAALLFALHPVNVEPVAEVSYREDLLATGFLLFSLLATIGFARHRGRKAVLWGMAAVLAIFLACASKETGAIGPLLLAACGFLFYRGQRWQRWVILIVAGAFMTSAFFFARSLLAPQNSVIFTSTPSYLGGSLASMLLIQPRLWTLLFLNILWPVFLSADYVAQNVAWITLPIAGIALSTVLALQIWLAWKSRLAAFGMLIFWLGLAPVSNFIPLFRPLADRFLYLPMVGVALIVASSLVRLLASPKWKVPTLAIAILSLLLLTGLNLQRQAVFASPAALWADTIAKAPFSHTAANNLGYALLETGNYKTALQSFQKAWELTGGKKADAAAGAAIAYEKLGDREQATIALKMAITLDTRYEQPPLLVQALVMPPEFADVLTQIVLRIAKEN